MRSLSSHGGRIGQGRKAILACGEVMASKEEEGRAEVDN